MCLWMDSLTRKWQFKWLTSKRYFIIYTFYENDMMAPVPWGNYVALIRGVDKNNKDLNNLSPCSVTLSYVKDDTLPLLNCGKYRFSLLPHADIKVVFGRRNRGYQKLVEAVKTHKISLCTVEWILFNHEIQNRLLERTTVSPLRSYIVRRCSRPEWPDLKFNLEMGPPSQALTRIARAGRWTRWIQSREILCRRYETLNSCSSGSHESPLISSTSRKHLTQWTEKWHGEFWDTTGSHSR